MFEQGNEERQRFAGPRFGRAQDVETPQRQADRLALDFGRFFVAGLF